jgi:hypothetical protein
MEFDMSSKFLHIFYATMAVAVKLILMSDFVYLFCNWKTKGISNLK